jgi:hypothetical protein
MRTSTNCGRVRRSDFFSLTKVGPVPPMLPMRHERILLSSRLRHFFRDARDFFRERTRNHFTPLLFCLSLKDQIRYHDLLLLHSRTWFHGFRANSERSARLNRTESHLYICAPPVLSSSRRTKHQRSQPWNGPHRSTKRSTSTAKSARTPTPSSNRISLSSAPAFSEQVGNGSFLKRVLFCLAAVNL